MAGIGGGDQGQENDQPGVSFTPVLNPTLRRDFGRWTSEGLQALSEKLLDLVQVQFSVWGRCELSCTEMH